jgi:hypothetical protein
MFRDLLRESGAPLDAMVEGVRQEDFAALERTLLALAGAYAGADYEGRRSCRRLVITAKDHAKLAGRKPELADEKGEMVLWMLTWLENPGVFADWVGLRKRQLPAMTTGDKR